MLFDVLSRPQIHRLIQGIALSEGIQIPCFNYRAHLRHVKVGWNGDVAHRDPAFPIEQTQFDAAFFVDLGDHSRTCGVELVLELIAAAVGASCGVRGIQALENHTFLFLSLQVTEHTLFVGRIDCCFHDFDVRDVRLVQERGEFYEPALIRLRSIILSVELQKIEGMKQIPNTGEWKVHAALSMLEISEVPW